MSRPTTLMRSSLLLPRRCAKRDTITGIQCSVNREQCGRSCASFGDRAAGGCAQRRSCGACIGERGERCGGSCASFGDRAAGGCAERCCCGAAGEDARGAGCAASLGAVVAAVMTTSASSAETTGAPQCRQYAAVGPTLLPHATPLTEHLAWTGDPSVLLFCGKKLPIFTIFDTKISWLNIPPTTILQKKSKVP